MFVTNSLISGCGIGFVILVGIVVCVWAYKVTDVQPVVVTQEQLDQQVGLTAVCVGIMLIVQCNLLLYH